LAIGVLLLGWWAFDAQAQRRSFDTPMRFPARGVKGAVAGGTDAAVDAGMRIFHIGGNAVDAGVSTMFAASMVEYSHFGFGGEAPILIRTKEGKVISLAGVGTMPKSATADFFRNRKMEPGEVQALEPNGLKGMVPVAGLMPALVPGMVEAGLVALREYGVKSFAEVIQPAIELADGAPLDEQRAGSIMRSRQFFTLWPTSKNVFLPGTRPVAPGMVFHQPDLARTLRAMAAAEAAALKGGASRQAAIDAVRDYFYRGAKSMSSPAPTAASSATKTLPASASPPKNPSPPPTAATPSTNLASGARAPPSSKPSTSSKASTSPPCSSIRRSTSTPSSKP
jgi:gamma-glutamyltranspeptidase/glutathione hydrolase